MRFSSDWCENPVLKEIYSLIEPLKNNQLRKWLVNATITFGVNIEQFGFLIGYNSKGIQSIYCYVHYSCSTNSLFISLSRHLRTPEIGKPFFGSAYFLRGDAWLLHLLYIFRAIFHFWFVCQFFIRSNPQILSGLPLLRRFIVSIGRKFIPKAFLSLYFHL